ncbi:MAG: hypothetical protein AB1306_08080 [Nitrospirota bacterium]
MDRLNEKDHQGVDREALIVSVILNSWCSLEGYINYITSIAKYAKKLYPHEKAFLSEMKLRINDNGVFAEGREYYPTATKMLFILNRFSSESPTKFKQTKLWNNIKISEDIRNKLTHPKEDLNFNLLNKSKAEFVNNTVREAIKYLNKKTLKGKVTII